MPRRSDSPVTGTPLWAHHRLRTGHDGYTEVVLCSGDVLSGRYRLDTHIATGGMGEVWRATDMSLDRVVAVKLLRSALLADPEFSVMLRIEAQTMAALAHPNVVKVYDYGHAPPAHGRAPYIVMSHVAGQPLSRRIAEVGRLSVVETGSVLLQLATALRAAHRGGIIHCDIKPANVLVAPDGAITLVDFGIARSTATTATTATQVIVCTAMYAAPEQVTGAPVSQATDIYALGAVAYHCLSGHPPFVGESPMDVALQNVYDEPPPLPADVPRALRMVVIRAMSKDPAHRHPTAAVFARAVRYATADRSTTTDRNSTGSTKPAPLVLPDLPWLPVRTRQIWRRSAPAMSAAAALLGAGGLVALFIAVIPAATSQVAGPSSPTPSISVAAAPAATTEPSATPTDSSPHTDASAPARPGGRTPAHPPAVAAMTSQLPGAAGASATISPSAPVLSPSPSTTSRLSTPPGPSPSPSPVVVSTAPGSSSEPPS